jgi:hypothetical protein
VPAATWQLAQESAPLPVDVAAAALDLWRAGHGRAALSLLYRGALIQMQVRHGLELPAAATETEVLRRAQARLPTEAWTLLAETTTAWEGLAYAGQAPAEDRVLALCRAHQLRLGQGH